MLSIGKLGSDPDPASYYLEVVASGVEDYYLSTDEVPGRWLGPAAPSLGLARPVEPEDLRAGLDGRHPRTGDPLGQRRRVPGFDLTLSAPRSVSLLWGLDAPAVAADVAAAHDEAVDAAMAYLEDVACVARRGREGRRRVRGAGLVAGAFRHRTSRAGDPHLHTHVVVANRPRGLTASGAPCSAGRSTPRPGPPGSSTRPCSATGSPPASASASVRPGGESAR